MVNALGYESKKISVFAKNVALNLNIQLAEKNTELDELIVKTEKAIFVKKDTISFKTKFFTNGTEQNVEELLKKIPGINIDDKGNIKIGDTEIEKLMIDGDDFFNKGYKVLSKNMPAYPIEEVEVLKRYSNNKHLKGIENSDKVALNLKLDEKSKNIWFGNAEVGLANNQYHQFKINLMNFGKKSKYYFLTNGNNVGIDAIGDVSSIIKPFSFNEPGSIGDNIKSTTVLGSSASVPGFSANKANFNNAKLVSLNAIFNPNSNLKIKPLVFLNWDKINFYRNHTEQVHLSNLNFTNTENYHLQNKKQIAFGKIDIIYDIAKNKTIEATTSFNTSNFKDKANLQFNGTPTLENLNHENQLIDQKIKFKNKLNDKKALLISGRFISEQAPQNYKVNQFYFQDLFPQNTNANAVKQFSENKVDFMGINANILNRKASGNLLELQVGNEWSHNQLNSKFFVLQDEIIINQPSDITNNTKYSVANFYAKAKYVFKFKTLEFASSLSLNQYFNTLKNNQVNDKESPFIINPNFNIRWNINNKNSTSINYSYNTYNADILNVYDGYVLTSFRSFNKAYGNFRQLNTSNYYFGYQLGNWSDRFFSNVNIMYSKNHDSFASNSILSQNYVLGNQIVVNNVDFLNVNSQLNYYFKSISTNLKTNLGYAKNNFKNIVNNSALRDIQSQSYNYGFELRSSFNGAFNFHVGSNWTENTITTTQKKSFTNNKSFLDFSFVFSPKINLTVQTEKYYFGNLTNKNTYYFINANASYRVIKDKLSFYLFGENLANTDTYTNFSISDVSTTITEYKLLPAYVMLKAEYRF